MAYNLSAFAGAGAQFFDGNGDPLTGGKLYVYTAGTTTPVTTWTTNSGAVANTNPIVLDAAGRTPNEIWLNSGVTYKFVLKTATDTLIGTYDNIPAIDDPTVFNNLISVSGTNTLIGTSVPPYTAYVAGMTLSFIPVNTNTGAVTIDVDGLGAKNIYVGASTPLSANDLVAGRIAIVEYDGTRFQLYSGSIADGAITTAKLADNAVTTIKIADANVTLAKLTDSGVTAGTYSLASITVDAKGRVTSASSNTQRQIQSEIFYASGTWTCPAGVTKVKAIVIGGGGGGGGDTGTCGPSNLGGYGGIGVGVYTVTPGTGYTITVGAGGAGTTTNGATGTAGGTSSFSTFLSCTGGGGGTGTGPGASGTATGATLAQGIANSGTYYIWQGSTTRPRGQSLAGVAYSLTSIYMPGCPGQGEVANSNNSAGGVGGIVYIEYVG